MIRLRLWQTPHFKKINRWLYIAAVASEARRRFAILSEKGYKVYELDKGFNAWQEAGEKVEK